ncbi:MAG: tRNA-guanine transglycosylase, partial [Candidatus Altiarchaeales archaeon]|nr:tRNA-guanine transglycosylase [Candidatus Altiarchaeales archaeon]
FERSKAARDAGFLVNAGVQGGRYLDLREKAAKALGAKFPLVAVGGIVPLMESYRFKELVDVIATVKKNIPANTLVHAFGLGHPMVFGLACALGCDFFDSAAYALYAQDDRYLTSYGTVHLEDLRYVGCLCPVCREYGLGLKNLFGRERVEKLAYHNLFVSYAELAHIKQAVSCGRLWDYLATRCRAHPALFEGFLALEKHMPWLMGLDPATKNCGLFYTGVDTSFRAEVLNARQRLKRVESDEKIDHPVFGPIPSGLMEFYPFGQSVLGGGFERNIHVNDLVKLRQMADYQFGEGAGALIPDNVVIKKSRKTKRIRWVYHHRGLFLTVRASDHFLLPKNPYAIRLHEYFKYPRLRVKLTDDEQATQCVREGKSVMCKFVEDVDENLLCRDECLVVDSNDNLIRVGTLHLSPKEIMDFDSGMAVRVR